MIRGLVVTLAAFTAGVAIPGAQQATFHGGTHTVSVYATVVDRTGRLVPSLSQDDFEVYDNGERQTLTMFKNDIQPITIVVMLDRSGSMVNNFTVVRNAAEQFVTDLLPADKAKVGSFSNRIQIDPAEFTSDPNELIHILRFNLQDAGPTPLWNATFAAMTALERQEGRRVVLVFTDGFDSPGRPNDNNMTLGKVVERSQNDEIMVYAIGLGDSCGDPAPQPAPSAQRRAWFQRGPRGPIGGRGPTGRGPGIGGRFPPVAPPIGGPVVIPGTDVPVGRGGEGGTGGRSSPVAWSSGPKGCPGAHPDPGLKTLADEGGGGYFELRGTDDLTATFQRVADELHHQYLLAFAASALDGKVHKLEVRLRDSNLSARARKSYLAPAGAALTEAARPVPPAATR
jgi:VWFA-related protein